MTSRSRSRLDLWKIVHSFRNEFFTCLFKIQNVQVIQNDVIKCCKMMSSNVAKWCHHIATSQQRGEIVFHVVIFKVVVHIRTSHLRPITALPSSERVEFIQNISLIRCLLHFALLCDLQQSVQFIIINKGQWLKLTSDWFLQNMKFDCSFLPLFRLFSKSDAVTDMMRRLLVGPFSL